MVDRPDLIATQSPLFSAANYLLKREQGLRVLLADAAVPLDTTHVERTLRVIPCGARRMAESAALLVDEVLPPVPIRQWVLSFTYHLRLPPAPTHESAQVAKQAGFSLHAGVMADSHLKELRERLYRYVSRSTVLEKRLARRISRHFSSTKTSHRLPRCGSTEGSVAPIGHFLQGNR